MAANVIDRAACRDIGNPVANTDVLGGPRIKFRAAQNGMGFATHDQASKIDNLTANIRMVRLQVINKVRVGRTAEIEEVFLNTIFCGVILCEHDVWVGFGCRDVEGLIGHAVGCDVLKALFFIEKVKRSPLVLWAVVTTRPSVTTRAVAELRDAGLLVVVGNDGSIERRWNSASRRAGHQDALRCRYVGIRPVQHGLGIGPSSMEDG